MAGFHRFYNDLLRSVISQRVRFLSSFQFSAPAKRLIMADWLPAKAFKTMNIQLLLLAPIMKSRLKSNACMPFAFTK